MADPSSDTNKKSTPVYFASIEVENVLCFKTPQKLDLCDTNGFPTQWTVILGDNGVGKTTLLRCIAAMTPICFDNRSQIPSPPGFSVDGNLVLKSSRYDEKLSVKAILVATSFLTNWKNELLRHHYRSNDSVEITMKVYGDSKMMQPDKIPDDFQCYGYGASRKICKSSLSETLSSDGISSLFSDNDLLINAEEWLLQTDYAVARSNPKTDKFKKRFDLVTKTLIQLLPDINNIRIVLADDNIPQPKAEFLTPYGWVSLTSLGLGYRTVIAWIVDLSARMIDRYPDSENPLAEPAVVLVDEIDLHLHPKWQRTIMSFLTERFPNVQFIVTAHSPLVVQAARNANLVLLRREGDHVVIDNNPEVIENWRVEQVLTSVFELPSTLPADIEPLVQRRREILAKSSLTKKDKQELKELEAKIGTLPAAESAADIQAMDIIRKAAKLLENR
jgi:AAA15 family ATPase/GTPase